ncbi:DUF2971 domain-containing protein [Mesorhizobium sp. M0904]|uniref:DUF2971 domain-containing protein n=1 Tax=Mesorhizobium sp. M0904 TaxID=2957022 RepID=UPI00333D8EA4
MAMKPWLRAEWKQAGYGTQMGSSAVVPPPSPALLRLYHITSAEYGLSNIGLKRLKVARFSALNDPFELLAADCKDSSIRSAAESYKKNYDLKHGLLCFSANWSNPLLWSHYAGKHTGICLGFDVPRNVVTKVIYEGKRRRGITLDGTSPDGLSDMVKELLIKTKFEHWAYEAEHRMILNLKKMNEEGSLHFKDFESDLDLSEVILGPLCPISLPRIRELVRSRFSDDVRVYKTRPAYGGYVVVPDEKSVDW